MNDAAAWQLRQFGIEMKQSVLQRPSCIARARMDHETRRLVDDDQMPVLEREIQIDEFRRDRNGIRKHGIQLDPLSTDDLVFGAKLRAVYEDFARLDPRLDSCAGVLADQVRQHLIEALPARLRGNRQSQLDGFRHREELFRQERNECWATHVSGWRSALGLANAILRVLFTRSAEISKNSMFKNSLTRLTTLAIAALLLAIGGCSNKTREAIGNADKLYELAKKAADNGNYRDAITYYEQLEARFPFSNPARQAQLDLMQAYYMNREPESAIDQADQFIRENPAHPRVDYAYYIKGLVQFERNPNFLERWFNADLSERPPIDARSSFQAFQTLIQRFPNSEYVNDARQRMIFLRNRLANYEVYVANYYLERGAYVGAINRAKYAIENYDGAPQIRRALQIMAESYRRLGLPELAADSERVIRENYANIPDAPQKKDHWWEFW